MKLKRFENYELKSLSDYWLATANEIESALIKAGVTANNYTAKELFELAKPFVLAQHSFLPQGLSICSSWPESTSKTAAEIAEETDPQSADIRWMARSPIPPTAPDQFIRVSDVEKLVSLKKSTLYAMVKANTFPAPHKLSRRIAVWSKHDVLNWISQRTGAVFSQ